MKLTVSCAEKKRASVDIDVSDIFLGKDFNEDLVHQVVCAYQAGGRAGTVGQKNRAAVSGGGRKPWRQKGTGRARAGSIRSPLWRGGGKIFPAETQSFVQKVNRKMYRGAMRSIFSELYRQERLIVVHDLKMQSPKTKDLLAHLTNLGVQDALIVIDEMQDALYLSARNLPHVDVQTASGVDPVSLIRYEKVIMTEAALRRLEEVLGHE